MTHQPDIGPIGGLPPEQVVRAAGLVREGRMISLAAVRYPGHAALPGPPAVPGPQLPDAARASG